MIQKSVSVDEHQLLDAYLVEGNNDGIYNAYFSTDLVEKLLSYKKTDHSHVYEPCEEMF